MGTESPRRTLDLVVVYVLASAAVVAPLLLFGILEIEDISEAFVVFLVGLILIGIIPLRHRIDSLEVR